jgi:hypothetical protein
LAFFLKIETFFPTNIFYFVIINVHLTQAEKSGLIKIKNPHIFFTTSLKMIIKKVKKLSNLNVVKACRAQVCIGIPWV